MLCTLVRKKGEFQGTRASFLAFVGPVTIPGLAADSLLCAGRFIPICPLWFQHRPGGLHHVSSLKTGIQLSSSFPYGPVSAGLPRLFTPRFVELVFCSPHPSFKGLEMLMVSVRNSCLSCVHSCPVPTLLVPHLGLQRSLSGVSTGRTAL